MDDKLLTQIRILKQYLDILDKISIKTEKEYLEDEILKGAAERYLQLSIETCINIGSRIVSLEQFNHNFTIPETYADVFNVLFEIGLIDEDFCNQLKGMARFRNKLVHVYWEIDNSFVYGLIKNNLEDIKKFLKITSEYIVKNS
ncbi:hypothetical protein Q428_01710 [Fervidicella metallireducens AeB]|uniref:DUF86 domain-containing protein n=1 Tax=Fervidicella metallireducens AeB TaxID=1403537 RepID=A0A017RYA2_9CLOT|nr:DUF86 domain-containing protein [Fervidicella metallireducens]EYE89531.1 hypothetical protein Q428_01710 [Fervidicella metallireducens AeB]